MRSVHYCPATKKTLERKYTDLTSLDAFPSSAIYPTKVSHIFNDFINFLYKILFTNLITSHFTYKHVCSKCINVNLTIYLIVYNLFLFCLLI